MTSPDMSYVPPEGQLLTPYVCVREAARAIDWYAEVLGATETSNRFMDPDGRVAHANLEIAGAHLMVSDAFPDYGAVAPEPGNTTATFALNLYVPDVDATVTAARAAGAVIQREPEDQFYGSRLAVLVDPFGLRWMLATHVKDVTAVEIDRAAADYSGAEPGPVG